MDSTSYLVIRKKLKGAVLSLELGAAFLCLNAFSAVYPFDSALRFAQGQAQGKLWFLHTWLGLLPTEP